MIVMSCHNVVPRFAAERMNMSQGSTARRWSQWRTASKARAYIAVPRAWLCFSSGNVMQADSTAWIWKNSLDSLSKKTLGGWKAISWVLSWRRDDDGCKMLQESPLFSWIYSTILVRTCQTWEHSSSEIDLKLCYFTVATWRKLVASAQTSSKHFWYIDVEPSLDFLKVWSPHDL